MPPRPLCGRPAQTGYEITEGNYRCIEYALEHLVDGRERANTDQPLDPDIASTILLTSQALIKRETPVDDPVFHDWRVGHGLDRRFVGSDRDAVPAVGSVWR